MARKVRYGISGTKYAIYDAASGTFGEYKTLPWAVALNLSTEGGDGTDFYADNGICFSFAGTNGGYSGDLEVSNIPDSVRADLLGEVLDEGTGAYFEVTGAEPPQFALVTEMLTDEGPIAFTFFNCKASRPEIQANTKNDNPDVDTETLPLRIASHKVTIGGKEESAVQAHIQRTSENAALYTAFFASVALPGSSGGSEGFDAALTALTIGALTLTPAFDPDTTAYAAATSNATNTITATAAEGATVAITVGGEAVESGSAATWAEGENAVAITVTSGTATKTYTVTVTKSE